MGGFFVASKVSDNFHVLENFKLSWPPIANYEEPDKYLV